MSRATSSSPIPAAGLQDVAARRGSGLADLLKAVAVIALAAAILLLPAAVTGEPWLYPDARAYLVVGQNELAAVGIHGAAVGVAGPQHASGAFALLAARSPTWSLMAYLLSRPGVWAPVVAQALILAWTLRLLLRVAAPAARVGAYLALAAGLTALSTAGAVAGLLMPDLFVPLAVIAGVTLVAYWDRLNGGERGALLILLAAAVGFHTTVGPIALVAAAVAGLALGAARRGKVRTLRAGAAVLAAAAIGQGAIMGIFAVESHKLRAPILQPPFLTARLLADGPGRVYLRRACAAGVAYELCRYKDKPFQDALQILWSSDPATGVFTPADGPSRLALDLEQPRFVAAVIRDDPAGVLAAAARNSLATLTDVSLSTVTGFRARSLIGAASDPRPLFGVSPFCWRTTGAPCGKTTAQAAWEDVIAVTAGLSGLGIALAAFGRRAWRPDPRTLAVCAAFVAAILVNAALCGALSNPDPRLNIRILWLAPLAFGLILVQARRPPRR
jgi:hypothetical protein